jgi:hypothetical protein
MSNVARTMVDHVLASAENVTATIGEDLGPLQNARYANGWRLREYSWRASSDR